MVALLPEASKLKEFSEKLGEFNRVALLKLSTKFPQTLPVPE
jgi:hypothetical protein